MGSRVFAIRSVLRFSFPRIYRVCDFIQIDNAVEAPGRYRIDAGADDDDGSCYRQPRFRHRTYSGYDL